MKKNRIFIAVLVIIMMFVGMASTANAADNYSSIRIGYKDFVVWNKLEDAKPVLFDNNGNDITSKFEIKTTHLFAVMNMPTYGDKEPIFTTKMDYNGDEGVVKINTYYYIAGEEELKEEIWPNQQMRFYGLMLEISGPIDPNQVIVYGAAMKEVKEGKLVIIVQLELDAPTERIADINCSVKGSGNGKISFNMPTAPSDMKYVYCLASYPTDEYVGLAVGNIRTQAGKYSPITTNIDVSFGPSYYAVALIDKNADPSGQNIIYGYHTGRITPDTITLNISNVSVADNTATVEITDNVFGTSLNGNDRGLTVRGCQLLSDFSTTLGTESFDFSNVKNGDTIYLKVTLYATSVAHSGPYCGLKEAKYQANVGGKIIESLKTVITDARDPYINLIFPVTYSAPVRKVTIVGGESFKFDVSKTGYAEGITVILTDTKPNNPVMMQAVEVNGTSEYTVGYDFISLVIGKSDITVTIKNVCERNYLQYKDLEGNILQDKVYAPSTGLKIAEYNSIYTWTGDNGKEYVAGDSFAFEQKPGITKVLILTERKISCPVNHEGLPWITTANGHERTCEQCGYHESHKIATVYSSSGIDSHRMECSVCHEPVTETVKCKNDSHLGKGTVVKKDANTHTIEYVCECGNKVTVEEAHVLEVKFRIEGDESTKYEACKVCGETQECKHNHTETREAVAASCAAEGFSGNVYCLDCGEMISAGTKTPKTEHMFGEWTEKTENGVVVSKTRECKICHFIEEKAVSEPEDTTDSGDNTGDKKNSFAVPLVIGGVAVAAAGTGTAVVMVKKKKKKE